LAVDARGNALVSFHVGAEDEVPEDAPLPLALVALWCGGKVMLVFDRYRGEWELPGGTIEDRETPRQAAVRELVEETGQVADGGLEFAGFAGFRLGSERRAEYGALFTGHTETVRAFAATSEIADLLWWSPDESPPGGSPGLDLHLVRLAHAASGAVETPCV
jgi:8-oxo-dGTP pyrophosphatase MutT (NUDIX family)